MRQQEVLKRASPITVLINIYVFYLSCRSPWPLENSILGFRVFLVGMQTHLAHLKLSQTALSWSVNSCVYNSALLLVLFADVLVNIVISFGFTERPKYENLAGSLWCRAPLKVQSSQRTAGVDLQ